MDKKKNSSWEIFFFVHFPVPPNKNKKKISSWEMTILTPKWSEQWKKMNSIYKQGSVPDNCDSGSILLA
jgi:hypothetical protein